MKSVPQHIRGVARHNRTVILLASAPENPSHVCPPAAIARSMWITLDVGIGVMDAMGYDPVYGAAFERERAEA